MNGRNQVRRIDLGVLRDNVAAIRRAVPDSARLLAVVKADAYGHGMIPVAREALRAGADWLAVALTEEGEALREAGVDAPILVLGATSPSEAEAGVAHSLTLTVCDTAMVASVQSAAEKLGKTGQVHLKIDSGMCRIGARTEQEVMDVLDAVEASPGVRLTGAFTHFADADGKDLDFTREQLTRFRALTSLLPDGLILHCANSAAIHRLPEAAMDMVRAGISMYGYPPVPTLMNLRPVMSWCTEVTYVKEIHPGDTVSYGRTFTADRPMRVATVACGYGDGYHRAASGKAQVLIGGRRAPVLGRICMDQMMADVTDIPGVKAGDEAVLLGRQGQETITAEEIAAWAGTISYEVLLAATGRVRREWLHAGQ
jgi:alanine racemase